MITIKTASLLLSVIAIASYDFISRVNVPLSSSERPFSTEIAKFEIKTAGYPADEMTKLIRQLQQSSAGGKAEPVENKTKFDSFNVGDTKVSLIAIYRHVEPVAVFSLSTGKKSTKVLRLKKNEEIAGYKLNEINSHLVQLSQSEQVRTLRLFTPTNSGKE